MIEKEQIESVLKSTIKDPKVIGAVMTTLGGVGLAAYSGYMGGGSKKGSSKKKTKKKKNKRNKKTKRTKRLKRHR